MSNMGLRIIIGLCLLCLTLSAEDNSEKVRFEGYTVLRVYKISPDGLKTLEELQNDPTLQLDFWTEPVFNSTADICVPPAALSHVTSVLKQSSIEYKVQIGNVQSLIDDEKKSMEKWRTHRRRKRSLYNPDGGSGADNPYRRILDPELFYWFNVVGQYASMQEIYEWMRFATYARPDLVRVVTIGFSYQKRPIKLAKIGLPRKDGKEKPAIWIDSGIHAREWVTVASVAYFLYQFVDGYGKYPEVTRMLDKYDWYLLPIHNPDGYEYSRDHNRMWRKNRAPTFNHKCNGVDLNRNYGYMWQKCKDDPEAKHCVDTEKPCSAVYGGPLAFSEPESKAVSNYVFRIRHKIKMFFSLHSYSQLWLLPWGYTRQRPADIDELQRVANAGRDAIQDVYGTRYMIGSPARILYHAGGSSMDWAKGVAGIQHSYLLELRDRGEHGFLLPARDILPTAEETWQGIVAAADAIFAAP